MSISTTSTKDSYSGNNSTTTPYPITFKYLESSHLTVYVDNVEISDSYYTLTGDGTTGTGQFTTALAYPSTKSIVVVLDVPFDQPTSLAETSALPAKTLEESFDRLNMQIRRVWRSVQNTLTFSTDEGGSATQGTADNLLGFDSTGALTEVSGSGFCKTANNLSDVTASTARTNLGVDAAGTDNSTDVTLAGTGTHASLAGQALTINKITAGDLNSESATIGQVLQADGDTTCSFVDLTGGGNALTSNPLSQFASTTSAEFAGVISDETGTGSVVLANSPTLVTPALGTPSAIDLTNATNAPLPASDTVTYDMIVDSSANSLLGSVAGGTVEEVTCTSAGRALIDDADASAQRTTLGVAIGSDVQAYSATLSDIVTEADTITANDNDTSIPTSAAVKDYVDNAGGGISFAQYTIADGTRNVSGSLNLTEEIDPDSIGTVSGGVVTLGAGSYQITHYGEYKESDANNNEYYTVYTRHNGSNKTTLNVNETTSGPNPDGYLSRCASFLITSASPQTVDIFVLEEVSTYITYRNVKLSILKLA